MKAFLSHSSRDKHLVEEVAHKLGAEQFELDSHTFDNGLLNVDAIRKALKRSSIFVLFLTEDAIESACVLFEALLAREFLAKGLVGKFLVICLDAKAFSKAKNEWKDFSFCLHLTSAQSIARRIQHHLIVDHASFSSKNQPYVERSKELNDLNERLMQPNTRELRGFMFPATQVSGGELSRGTSMQTAIPPLTLCFPRSRSTRWTGMKRFIES